MLDVHDDVAQAEEVLRVQRLGEEVGEVVVRVDERHAKTMVLDALAEGDGPRRCGRPDPFFTRAPSRHQISIEI